MKRTLRAVALRTVKHNEKSAILTAWSAESGRVSLVVSDGGGAGSRRRRALTMPLSLFEAVVDVVPGRELQTATSMRALVTTPHISASPVKATVAMFLAEVLGRVLRQSEADEGLWMMLSESVVALDAAGARGTAVFALRFLSRLAVMLGIAPDARELRRGYGLDLREGRFSAAPSSGTTTDDFIAWPQSRIAANLVGARGYGHGLPLTRGERNMAVDYILRYISMHYAPLPEIKSLEVLRAL